MTARSIKRVDVLERRRHGRHYRKQVRPRIRKREMDQQSIRDAVQRALDGLDRWERGDQCGELGCCDGFCRA